MPQRPAADLVVRPNSRDEVLTDEQLERLTVFAGLKKQPEFEELPGTVILRCYRKGDVVCRLGDPGWTAFYILTPRDIHELGKGGTGDAAAQPRIVAQAHLGRPAQGLWGRLREMFVPGSPRPALAVGDLREGELFGEISCLYRMPRTATVVVTQDPCYVLEMYRHILDRMLSNQNRAFQEQIDAAYRQRLGLHLRTLPLFADLDDASLKALQDRAELQAFEPGALICDEHDASDCMYLIRSGFVKVLKNSSYLLGLRAIPAWGPLCHNLEDGGPKPTGPRQRLWELLGEPAREAVRALARDEDRPVAVKQCLLDAVNGLLKRRDLVKEEKLVEGLSRELLEEGKKLPARPEKWEQHQQVRHFNRRLLEAVCPGVFPPYARPAGDIRVLNYRSVGDVIGERGVIANQPRMATCVAYDHPESKFGRVETVRLSRELFEQLRARSPALQRHIEEIVRQQIIETEQLLATPAWEATSPVALTERFEELGLIQGQKLMLIDLERCTRCDECVRACVNTHTDGRSRLFLDGPRFKAFEDGALKQYLTPFTCRQCKDPVCLIGCPVGSIHRGNTGQIVIEDWCIGCARCANQCPYGAIQMHPIGIIPRRSRGWRWRPAPGEPDRGGSRCAGGAATGAGSWQALNYRDASWRPGQTPFTVQKDFHDEKAAVIQFRYTFDLSAAAVASGSLFLQVLSLSPSLSVWVNGVNLLNGVNGKDTKMKPKDKGEEWNFEETFEAGVRTGSESGPKVLRPGRNVVAIEAARTAKETDVLLELALYQRHQPVVSEVGAEPVPQERVMNLAVVCDMCSSSFGSHPACVRACPHEAAMRIEARRHFPIR
jgi:Fe-S-cluster-containing hydrogenase component 2